MSVEKTPVENVSESLAQPTQVAPSSSVTLHHLNSSQSLRVLWALEELSPFPYNLELYTRVKARAPPELKEFSTLGKSPVLVVDEPGKPRVTVLESRLILQYIADHYSNGVWSEGQTPKQKFRDAYWTEFATASFGFSVTLAMIFGLIPGQTPFLARPLMSLVAKGVVPQLLSMLKEPLRTMEEALSQAPWFAGDKLGMADFVMSWPMDMADQRDFIKWAEFPNLAAWMKRVHDRPAYERALQKGGEYDLKNFGLN